MKRRFLGAAAALFVMSACVTVCAASCAIGTGGRVVLASDQVDPDVFLWDTRDRLVDFAAGHWNSSRTISEHTFLAKPGTRAVVIACTPAFAHPHYSDAQDVIHVKVVTGPFRGKQGWVMSSDLHLDPDGGNLSNQAAHRNR